MYFSKKYKFLYYWIKQIYFFDFDQKQNTVCFSRKNIITNSLLSKSLLENSNNSNTFIENVKIQSSNSTFFIYKKYSDKSRFSLIKANKDVLNSNSMNNLKYSKSSFRIDPHQLEQSVMILSSNRNNSSLNEEILSQNKQWYSYWLLPFVGFVLTLPSFLPNQKYDSYYGFKYFNYYLSNRTSENNQKITNYNKDFYSGKLLNSSTKLLNREKSYFLYYPHLKLKITNDTNITNKNFIKTILTEKHSDYGPRKINGDFLHSLTKSEHSFVLNNELPIKNYKKYELILNSLIQNIFYLKDETYENSIHLLNNTTNFSQITNTYNINFLTNIFKSKSPSSYLYKHIYELNNQNNTIINTKNQEINSLLKKHDGNINELKLNRFLESYEDSLFFYSYIITKLNNTLLISKVKLDSSSIQNDLINKTINLEKGTNIYNNFLNSCQQINSNNQFKVILNVKNPELVSWKQSFVDNLNIKENDNKNLNNTNSYLSYLISQNDFTKNNSTNIYFKNNQVNEKNINDKNYKFKLSNYLNFLQLQLAKNIKIKTYQKLKSQQFDYMSERTDLKNSKLNINQILNSSEDVQFVKNSKEKTNNINSSPTLRFSKEVPFFNIQTYKLIKDKSSLLLNVRSNDQIMRNFILSKKQNLTNINNKINTIKNVNVKLLITNLQKKSYKNKKHSNFEGSIDYKNVLTSSTKKNEILNHNKILLQPIDLLRIKHFIFLNNFEKNELKIFKNINNILKEEKLLYEINNRENQLQKRRKKKRKRWTRRRRKRKRKLLRPLWLTLNFAQHYYLKRITQKPSEERSSSKAQHKNNIFMLEPLIINKSKFTIDKNKLLLGKHITFTNNYSFLNKKNTNLILDSLCYQAKDSTNLFYSSKDLYLLSKKVLSELSNMKKNRTNNKKFLHSIQKLHTKETKYFLNQEIQNILVQNFNLNKTNIKSTKLNINNKLLNNIRILEYNRIMYEKIQNFIINSSTNNLELDQSTKNTQINLSSILQRTNLLRIKLIQNAPKEEWMWLFKYITKELPREPILSNQDRLRSLWAMGKSNYINQWTGWKNFYYQEFKKGLTPNYQLWQDKKPDKRYNVNNLKKRQYKQSKKLQRLRVFPQLSRGTYFALNRDINKLSSLGINLNITNISNSQIGRPIDKLRKTLKDLKLQSNEKLFISKDSYSNNKNSKSSTITETTIKPIMDTYKNWWENTLQSSWGWKTLQYGAPWDRKTLYLPTQFSNNNLINSNFINIKSYNELDKGNQLLQNNKVNLKFLLIATLLLHICTFLALVSISELRYTLKVNMILLYKVSSIPWKIASSIVDPLFKKTMKQQSSLSFTDIKNSSFKKINLVEANSELISSISTNDRKYLTEKLNSNFINKLVINKIIQFQKTKKINNNSSFVNFSNTTQNSIKLFDILNNSYTKIGFYSILKQSLKQEIRYNNIKNQSLNIFIKAPNSYNEIFSYIPKTVNKKLTLNSLKLTNNSISFGLTTYYSSLQLIELFIDSLREFTRSIYDFFSLPENFSPNPDEVGLDVLANFIYDFEEPLNELLPDVLETQIDKYINRFILTLSVFGPIGLLLQQRINWFYRMFVNIIYTADADYFNDEQELYILYTVWADILNKAAEELDLEASIIASQEDQRINLLDYLVNTAMLDTKEIGLSKTNNNHFRKLVNNKLNNNILFEKSHKDILQKQKINPFSIKTTLSKFIKPNNLIRSKFFYENINSSEKKESINNWLVDQYVLYKTDETDLFLEINSPKSFSHVRAIKHYDILQQPLGTVVCQMYSGIFSKQMAKNLLIITDQITDKSSIIQALAGETELKLILDNSSRYASISQNVAVGMRMLRDVFDAIALQTPCIFVLEDIHLIGEKRPFLISDEDLALVTNSGLGLEQHQLYEKNQKIQQHSKHRISYFKKAYRGDSSDSLPTNLLCYDLFLNQLQQTEWKSNSYPISIDFHRELESFDTSGITNSQNIMRSLKELNNNENQLKIANSHLNINEIFTNSDNPIKKVSHLIYEFDWSTKNDESQKTSLISLRHKVSTIADQSLSNISLKLDRITQLLVIMDNVRKNKGFIVFGTTNKPQLLDPALRRPGRLEETISLPSIPNLLSKWEILLGNISITSSNLSNKYTFDLLQTSLINTQLNFFFKQSPKVGFLEYKEVLYKNISNQAHLYTNFNSSQKLLQSSKNNLKHKKSILLKTNILKILLFRIGSTNKLSIKNKNKLINYCNFKQNQFSRYNFDKKNSLINEIILTKYEKIGKLLIQIMYDQQIFELTNLEMNFNNILESSIYSNLYSSKDLFKNDLIKLFAGLVGNYLGNSVISNNIKEKHSLNLFTKESINSMITLTNYSTKTNTEWQLATKLIYSYIQKRAVYSKNKYIHKLLNMNQDSLNYYPSPPITSLLLPAKRYENYLKAQRDLDHPNVSGIALSIQEKIQSHLNQRVLKRLYKLPIKEFYKSEIIENTLTNFSSSTLTLPFDSINFAKQNKQSKTNYYYRNIFIKRHSQYLINQWWNAHLTEYNIETTVMSEIDFKSIIFGNNELNKTDNQKLNTIGDLLIDFPDADQHYNPKQRRWFIQSTCWKNWSDVEKGLTTDIISHYIFETFSTTYQLLDKNRELLDNLVYKFIKNSQIQESETIEKLSRFY